MTVDQGKSERGDDSSTRSLAFVRFGLKALLLVMAALACVLALLGKYGLEATAEILMIAVLVTTPVWLTFGVIYLEDSFRRKR